MTVAEYTKLKPNTILAKKLANKFGNSSRKRIWVGHGLVSGGGGYGWGNQKAATNSPNSNIGRLMRQHGAFRYVVGGRAGKNALLLQSGWQRLKEKASSAIVKMGQIAVIQTGVIRPASAAVSHVVVTIRWIDAKQHAIAEQIRAAVTAGFPVVGMPSPACAPVTIASNQRLAAPRAKSVLPIPSLLYNVTRKHDNHSSFDEWRNNGEDIWVRYQDGRETSLLIYEIPPYSIGDYHHTKTVFHIRDGDKDIADAPTLTEAKRVAEEHLHRVL